MDIPDASAAVARVRLDTEISMTVLDKTLNTARSGVEALLDALPAADPSKGRRFDAYG